MESATILLRKAAKSGSNQGQKGIALGHPTGPISKIDEVSRFKRRKNK